MIDVYNGWNDDKTLPEMELCPFCGGVAILKDNGFERPVIDPETGAYVDMDIVEGDVFWCECLGCEAISRDGKSPEEAIKNWNRRSKLPNAPLTLEQLRGMDGEPVWWWNTSAKPVCTICVCDRFMTEPMFANYDFMSEDTVKLTKYKWLKKCGYKPYRHKPEDERT